LDLPTRLHIFTLTQGQDNFHGFGADVFNAPLSVPQGGQLEGQPTLTDGDSLVEESPVVKGVSAVLNATFDGSWTAASLNIVGIPVWNIDNTGQSHHHEGGTVTLTGDGPGGPNVISGLRVLNYNADSGSASLLIGDNAEPVQEPLGANGFAINVNDAVGNGHNGVDVDIDASAFTGNDTIFVTATRVGGFPEDNGSFVVPPPILVADDNGDDYDPNWVGYLGNAFAIASGASAGPNGPVGFAHWDVTSNGAGAIGSLNILALGGEGSTSATSLTMHDDGSNTMVYATSISDSRSTDWEHLNNINLQGTSGFVTLTGAETDEQEELDLFFMGKSNKDPFQFFGGGGFLTSVIGPINVLGGSGNSFYDFSGLDSSGSDFLRIFTTSSFDGGHGTTRNSEIAFNNNVLTEDGAPGGGTTVVQLSNISILDDTGTPFHSLPTSSSSPWIAANELWQQGGTINMANFPLVPTHVPYALLAEDLNPDGGLVPPATVPFGLPFTQVPNPLTPFVPVDGATLPSTISQDWANDFTNGVVPAGFEILQFLNGEGSTASTLTSKLQILNGPDQFAINMQDMADGFRTDLASAQTIDDVPSFDFSGFDIFIAAASANTTNTLVVFVSDDGVQLGEIKVMTGGSSSMSLERDFETQVNTAFIAPIVTIDNYNTVVFVLPTESVGEEEIRYDNGSLGSVFVQNWVVLGSTAFIDNPIVTASSASVNFFDNNADNGGSPPGGEDNLVLGHTNFTAVLTTDDIGTSTVSINSAALDFSKTINDFGTGLFEIGATNATNLNAQSTSHLIMDLPGTDFVNGIIVNGSIHGQNLLQGTSGDVDVDHNGHFPPINSANLPVTFQGVGKDILTGLYSGTGHDVTQGGVGDTFENQKVGGVWQVGNDTLTGGDASVGGTVQFTEVGGEMGVGVTYFGNDGDNFFPEGGNDVVNISHTTPTAEHFSNVFFAMYDVCNSGGPNFGGTLTGSGPTPLDTGVGSDWSGANGSGLAGVYGQAVTDIVNGTEIGVDGYGNDITTPVGLLTIHGFEFGTGTSGDTLMFNVDDWAVGALTGHPASGSGSSSTTGTFLDLGLVESDSSSMVREGEHNADATLFNVGFAGEFTTTGIAAGTVLGTNAEANVIMDSISPYANAADLASHLTQLGVGDINLAREALTAGSKEHILIAYQSGSDVKIADVTITNTSGSTQGSSGLGGLNTANTNLHVSAVDLIDITGTSLPSLNPHNIHFV